MANIWLSSDLHLGHANILKFKDKDGKNVRSFSSVEEMNETLIQRHNSLVKPEDHWYNLGDVYFGHRDNMKLLHRFNGRKRLVLGNHDNIKQGLEQFFEKIVLIRHFKDFGFVASHMPLHESQLYSYKYNVHGHIHQNEDVSPNHLNISVERTNYYPVHIDQIAEMFKEKQK